jgi:hypothetical protein
MKLWRFVIFAKYLDDQTEKNRIKGICRTYTGKIIISYRILVRKPAKWNYE